MKKIILLFFVVFLLTQSAVFADDTGIQIIGGSGFETPEYIYMDDWKVDQTVVIPSFGEVTLVSAKVMDIIKSGQTTVDWFPSGDEADYISLVIDILNTQTVPVDFYKMFGKGKCTFERDGLTYEFGLWYRQFRSYTSQYVFYNKDDSYGISPMYRGLYLVNVTLPNDIINSKDPLSISFNIGNNEFTHYLRK